MPTFKITTLGCKVNQCESDAISSSLKKNGWADPETEEKSDLCIINTCAVTGKASMQSRQAIRKLIRENPNAKIIVTGCAAQIEEKEIAKIKGVHHIIPHPDKQNIPDLIFLTDGKPETSPSGYGGESFPKKTSDLLTHTPAGKRTRPFLKVQDGCNSFCSYCVVPYSRGRSRSMPADQVISHLNHLAQAGYHEVVLTGIHLGVYGLDLNPATTLFELLRNILKSSPIERLRLSSIEPGELSDDLIHLVSDSSVLCDHFHIPLQSGDDTILTSMGRPYSASLFEDRVYKIKKMLPDAGIGTDILAGFSGETEKQFLNTVELIEKLPISYLHVFPFSPRKGTAAYSFKNRVPDSEVRKRSMTLRALGKKKRLSFFEKAVGQTREILIETQRDANTGLLKGLSTNYIQVLVDGPDDLKNSIRQIRLARVVNDYSIYGAEL
ncbi:MAG: tRNA (N(6)-L-threonylcarbamoyladenosine(37)-C(2))-methylthiotransferase MtaB [Proteobacteria bacterium]|nr:tRNA (N(6)-L-threonylcarbamoyladenosine(37)-C(2))-methylthiotransferase MtaB [Pseudomonadota bacterium]